MNDTERLRDLIASRSFRQSGEFTLASGRTSTLYFNLKPTMLHPLGASLIGTAIARKAAELEADLIGGMEMGAVPLVAAGAVQSVAEGRPVPAIFVRKQAKAHGTQSLIEGLAIGESLAERRILLIEDVTTTGGSSLKAIAILRDAGAVVTDVLTIVDRQEGAREAFSDAGVRLHAMFRKSDFGSETPAVP